MNYIKTNIGIQNHIKYEIPSIRFEKFVTVKYNNNYKIGNKGTIINKKGNICKPFINNSGYYCIGLWSQNKKKTYCVHKLVAEHFIEDYNKHLDVDHINHNKLDNNINNLRLITHKENCFRRITPNIYLVNKKGDIIQKFSSCDEAAKNLHIGKNQLMKAINNKGSKEIVILYSRINKCILYFKRF